LNPIADNYNAILDRVAAACVRAGRSPEEVRVIGVTKTKPAATVREASEAGITDVGENYVQEIVEKHDALGDIVRWHFIGHLQRNKVRAIAPFVSMIHGVESERLGVEIDRQAESLGRRIPVLMQVNTSGEESKFGIDPGEAPSLAAALARLPNIELAGLMTIAAFLDDQEFVRPMFRHLRTLRDSISRDLAIPLPHLSMGMTADFEAAIEEGATLVRIGTALFGSRG
jgi:pyridoxal phosphate enzyme (YggS family)